MSDAILRNERLLDLLVKQATDGVTSAEQLELDRLLARHDGADPQFIERIAAALSLAGDLPDEALPAGLRARIEAQALKELPAAPSNVTALRPRSTERPHSGGGRLGWLAAAACLVLAVTAWWPRLRDMVEPPARVTQMPPRELSAAEQRLALLQNGATVSHADWSNTDDPGSQGVKGDVVWDNNTQRGFIRFTGLAANDPKQSQYQLWIFDARRDDRYPIDGGVFDIPPNAAEVVLPINARLAVNEPAAFAVTIEKPGGVVVSAREHVVALAKIAPG
ncbi:MAG TPA: anti-sigma factor [Steroidobacteraceae bacterium]